MRKAATVALDHEIPSSAKDSFRHERTFCPSVVIAKLYGCSIIVLGQPIQTLEKPWFNADYSVPDCPLKGEEKLREYPGR